MESMVTASIGIFKTQRKFYLQIISAKQYQFYYCEINYDVARLISEQENLEIENVFELPAGTILNTPAAQFMGESPNVPKMKSYINTEESFRKFQATKKIFSIAEYLEIMNTNDDEEYYKGVKVIFLYQDNTPIFEIKEGESWQYDPLTTAAGRYTYFKFLEKIYESNDLEEVEREMFKDVLKYYSY